MIKFNITKENSKNEFIINSHVSKKIGKAKTQTSVHRTFNGRIHNMEVKVSEMFQVF
jgi:hypothetical protein